MQILFINVLIYFLTCLKIIELTLIKLQDVAIERSVLLAQFPDVRHPVHRSGTTATS